MLLKIVFPLLLFFFDQISVEGTYTAVIPERSPVGRLKHKTTLVLNSDKTYQYSDTAFSHNTLISTETNGGTWHTMGDTLITSDYHIKWLIKRHSLIKMAVDQVRYKKE